MMSGWAAGAVIVLAMIALLAAWVRGGRVEPHSVELPVSVPAAAGHA